MVDLWVDPDGPGGAAAAAVLGIEALPTRPRPLWSRDRHATVYWFGPQEWLVTTDENTDRSGEVLEAQLREVVGEHGGAAVDVSAQRTTLRLRGEHAREVLAKGTSLDLHPRVFGPGAAAQTMLGLAGVVLIPLNDTGTDYRILVRSSFAALPGRMADRRRGGIRRRLVAPIVGSVDPAPFVPSASTEPTTTPPAPIVRTIR